MPDKLPDLGKVKENAAAREAAEAAVRQAAREKLIEEQAVAWDKAMTRTFKGIFPAPLRRSMLTRAVVD